MTIEEQIIEHLIGVPYSNIPETAIDAARREVLWTLGTSFAGAAAPSSDQIIAFVRQVGGKDEATVIGFGDRIPASLAGLANGAFAKALEYEDKFWLDHSHAYAIGTSVIPAAFATAEHIGSVNGKDFLRAVALATDVAARMIKAVRWARDTQWNSTYVFASFEAAMVAGVLLGLNREQFFNAMGLAYAQTTGNYQGHQEGVLGVRMQMGFAVRNGVTAAQMAKLGMTGVKHFLTGKFGLYPAFFKDVQVDLDLVTKDLGHDFFGERLGFKAYPCCAAIHQALDAILGIVKERTPKPETVDSVNVYTSDRARLTVEPRELRWNPRTHVDLQFSLPWAVACAIIDHKLSLAHFTDDALRDRRYLELAGKVQVDMAADREAVWVELNLKDGQTLRSEMVLAPKGHHENPLSTDDMVERYRDCVQHGPKPLPAEQTELAKDLVLRLQEVSDVAEVIRLLG